MKSDKTRISTLFEHANRVPYIAAMLSGELINFYTIAGTVDSPRIESFWLARQLRLSMENEILLKWNWFN